MGCYGPALAAPEPPPACLISSTCNHLATPSLTASTISRPRRPSAATPAFSSALIRSGATARGSGSLSARRRFHPLIAKARARLLQYRGVALAALRLAVARLHTHSLHCYPSKPARPQCTTPTTSPEPGWQTAPIFPPDDPARPHNAAAPRLAVRILLLPRLPLYLVLMKALLPSADKALPTAVPT